MSRRAVESARRRPSWWRRVACDCFLSRPPARGWATARLLIYAGGRCGGMPRRRRLWRKTALWKWWIIRFQWEVISVCQLSFRTVCRWGPDPLYSLVMPSEYEQVMHHADMDLRLRRGRNHFRELNLDTKTNKPKHKVIKKSKNNKKSSSAEFSFKAIQKLIQWMSY